jgi:hypothetical protein
VDFVEEAHRWPIKLVNEMISLKTIWQAKRGSNSQPPVLETGALPIELLACVFTGLQTDRNGTRNRLNKGTVFPMSLAGLNIGCAGHENSDAFFRAAHFGLFYASRDANHSRQVANALGKASEYDSFT